MNASELLERYAAGERSFDVTDLEGTNLNDAKLVRAELSEACLSDVKLIRADLTDADLRGAILIRAILSRAILIRANLIQANLEGADTIDASFEESLLCQLNFRQIRPARLTLDNMDIYCANALLWNTVMPDGTLVAEPKYDTRY